MLAASRVLLIITKNHRCRSSSTVSSLLLCRRNSLSITTNKNNRHHEKRFFGGYNNAYMNPLFTSIINNLVPEDEEDDNKQKQHHMYDQRRYMGRKDGYKKFNKPKPIPRKQLKAFHRKKRQQYMAKHGRHSKHGSQAGIRREEDQLEYESALNIAEQKELEDGLNKISSLSLSNNNNYDIADAFLDDLIGNTSHYTSEETPQPSYIGHKHSKFHNNIKKQLQQYNEKQLLLKQIESEKDTRTIDKSLISQDEIQYPSDQLISLALRSYRDKYGTKHKPIGLAKALKYLLQELSLSTTKIGELTFTTLLTCCKTPTEGRRVFKLMNEHQHPISKYSWSILVDIYAKNNDFQGCADVMEEMTRIGGIKPSLPAYTSLIASCYKVCNSGRTPSSIKAKAGQLGWKKWKELCKLPDIEPDVMAYGAILRLCSARGHPERSINILEEMISKEVKPTTLCFTAALKAVFKSHQTSIRYERGFSRKMKRRELITYHNGRLVQTIVKMAEQAEVIQDDGFVSALMLCAGAAGDSATAKAILLASDIRRNMTHLRPIGSDEHLKQLQGGGNASIDNSDYDETALLESVSGSGSNNNNNSLALTNTEPNVIRQEQQRYNNNASSNISSTRYEKREYGGNDTRKLSALLLACSNAAKEKGLGDIWAGRENQGYLCDNSLRLIIERPKPRYRDNSIPGMTQSETLHSALRWKEEDPFYNDNTKKLARKGKFEGVELDKNAALNYDDLDENLQEFYKDDMKDRELLETYERRQRRKLVSGTYYDDPEDTFENFKKEYEAKERQKQLQEQLQEEGEDNHDVSDYDENDEIDYNNDDSFDDEFDAENMSKEMIRYDTGTGDMNFDDSKFPDFDENDDDDEEVDPDDDEINYEDLYFDEDEMKWKKKKLGGSSNNESNNIVDSTAIEKAAIKNKEEEWYFDDDTMKWQCRCKTTIVSRPGDNNVVDISAAPAADYNNNETIIEGEEKWYFDNDEMKWKTTKMTTMMTTEEATATASDVMNKIINGSGSSNTNNIVDAKYSTDDDSVVYDNHTSTEDNIFVKAGLIPKPEPIEEEDYMYHDEDYSKIKKHTADSEEFQLFFEGLKEEIEESGEQMDCDEEEALAFFNQMQREGEQDKQDIAEAAEDYGFNYEEEYTKFYNDLKKEAALYGRDAMLDEDEARSLFAATMRETLEDNADLIARGGGEGGDDGEGTRLLEDGMVSSDKMYDEFNNKSTYEEFDVQKELERDIERDIDDEDLQRENADEMIKIMQETMDGMEFDENKGRESVPKSTSSKDKEKELMTLGAEEEDGDETFFGLDDVLSRIGDDTKKELPGFDDFFQGLKDDWREDGIDVDSEDDDEYVSSQDVKDLTESFAKQALKPQTLPTPVERMNEAQVLPAFADEDEAFYKQMDASTVSSSMDQDATSLSPREATAQDNTTKDEFVLDSHLSHKEKALSGDGVQQELSSDPRLNDLAEALPGMPVRRLKKILSVFEKQLGTPSMLRLVPLLRENMPEQLPLGWLKRKNLQNASFVMKQAKEENLVDIHMLNGMLEMYTSTGNIDRSLAYHEEVFKSNEIKPTEYSDRLVIQMLVKNHRLPRALQFKQRVEESGRKLDILSYGSIMDYYSRRGQLGSSVMLLKECVSIHGAPPPEKYLTKIRLLCRQNDVSSNDIDIVSLIGEDPVEWIRHGEQYLKREMSRKGRKDVKMIRSQAIRC